MEKPWASFCMSTYNRPDFLRTQVEILLQQTFTNFEIVISDNDPLESGRITCESFNDPRVKYFANEENLGMVKSFNKSIDRSSGDFIVMVTDDDPVDSNMLEYFFQLQNTHPGFSMYCGAKRGNKPANETEIIEAQYSVQEILDPKKTIRIHWSSCLLRKESLLKIGKLADYGSGHLVDHLMLSLIGMQSGIVIVNREFSSIQYHDNNYSKSNIDNYYKSCTGFYEYMKESLKEDEQYKNNIAIVLLHLHRWFIICFFSLRKFYTKTKHTEEIPELDLVAKKIMDLPYMQKVKGMYAIKKFIFGIKLKTGIL